MKKCNIHYWNGKVNQCEESVYIIIKVNIFHPDTLRKSWQKWALCKKHFIHFARTNGKDYYCKYKRKGNLQCPVIAWKEF